MIYFTESRQKAFEEFSKVEKVKEVKDAKKKRELGFDQEENVWEVTETEIEGNNGNLELVGLHVVLPDDFPLSLPKVYLAPKDSQRLGYLPHVDTKRLICTYNSNNTRTVPTEPGTIIKICVTQAQRILTDGLSGRNFGDFEEEFLAYWELNFGTKDKVERKALSLIAIEPINTSLRVIVLEDDLQNFKYILHTDDHVANRFKKFLDERKLSYSEVEGFYAAELPIDTVPPYTMNNRETKELIDQQAENVVRDFKRFINKPTETKVVVFKKKLGTNAVFIGWIHQKLEARRKVDGFRPGTYTKFHALYMLQGNEKVIRLSPEPLTRIRLRRRTAGIQESDAWVDYNFAIAGVGSVGSYLIHFLNSLGCPEFRLIDIEWLGVENIERHLLGFNYVGQSKTRAIRNHLLDLNPTQLVTQRDQSVIKICLSEPEYLNEADYLFVAIGNSNIDSWLAENQILGTIKVPMFLLWVEPYLAGGHCLYLHPADANYRQFFDKSELFVNNIISASEYTNNNKLLALKEAGCQSSYVPYSSSNLMKFVGELFPYIADVIQFGNSKSQAWSWIGDLNILTDLNIELSKFGQANSQGGIVKVL